MPFSIMGHNCMGSFKHWALCLLDFITPGHFFWDKWQKIKTKEFVTFGTHDVWVINNTGNFRFGSFDVFLFILELMSQVTNDDWYLRTAPDSRFFESWQVCFLKFAFGALGYRSL